MASAFFGTNGAIYAADITGDVQEVWRLPAQWLRGRHLIRLATHITELADGCLLLDGELADREVSSVLVIHEMAVGPSFKNGNNAMITRSLTQQTPMYLSLRMTNIVIRSPVIYYITDYAHF